LYNSDFNVARQHLSVGTNGRPWWIGDYTIGFDMEDLNIHYSM